MNQSKMSEEFIKLITLKNIIENNFWKGLFSVKRVQETSVATCNVWFLIVSGIEEKDRKDT